METRANHLLIGSFVLVSLVAMFGFIVWLARLEVSREFDYYRIYFTESVAGLGVGGDVRFNGIRVGTVTGIDFDPADPRRVAVTIQVAADTPVREDAYATLQLQGITGVSFVQIAGGTPDAAVLDYRPGRPPPVIPSRTSEISRVVESAPELLARGILVLERLNQILSPENEQRIGAILDDTARLTATLAGETQRIQRIIGAADTTAAEVAETARAMRRVAERVETVTGGVETTLAAARETVDNVDEVVREDLKALLKEVRSTAASFGRTAGELQAMLAENRAAISEFTADGLAQFGRFIRESRQLVSAMARVTERIEADPARFLFGDRAPEHRAQ